MNDVPLGIMTGNWDTAVGVPKQNGDIDTTRREARDCFVYAEHQWLNQGCVATHNQKDTLGAPLNKKGGGVFGKKLMLSMKIQASLPNTEHANNQT